VPVGSVWLVHPARPFLTSRVRAFVDLAKVMLGASAWARPKRGARRDASVS
jgi:hypothetical protein